MRTIIRDFLLYQQNKLKYISQENEQKQHLASHFLAKDGSGEDKILNQIFPIHAYKQGKQHPLIYAFLTNKSKATYDRLFYIIQEKAQNL